LLGLINDFPLSNLLITTPLGRFIFPCNYANHLMAFSYDPENFLHLLKAQLHERSGKPYLLASAKEKDKERALFMETALSMSAITEQHISVPKVINTAAKMFQVDPANGAISMKKAAIDSVNKSAEKAVLQGNWLLANLPATVRYKKVGKEFIAYITPPQYILVDVSTGKWTAEMNTPLAASAPLPQLQDKLVAFYGAELS
jgi:hypothetical protein